MLQDGDYLARISAWALHENNQTGVLSALIQFTEFHRLNGEYVSSETVKWYGSLSEDEVDKFGVSRAENTIKDLQLCGFRDSIIKLDETPVPEKPVRVYIKHNAVGNKTYTNLYISRGSASVDKGKIADKAKRLNALMKKHDLKPLPVPELKSRTSQPTNSDEDYDGPF